jgi:hypothetical protein
VSVSSTSDAGDGGGAQDAADAGAVEGGDAGVVDGGDAGQGTSLDASDARTDAGLP